MSNLCGRCNDVLTGSGELDATCCSVCAQRYHFECNTLSENSWRTYGPTRRGAWKCSSCKDGNVPAASKPPLKQLNIPITIEDLGKRFVEMETNLTEKLSEFTDSLNFYGDRIDELAKTIKTIETKNLLIEKRLTTQEAENIELKSRVKDLEGLLRQQEQREHACKMEITGLKNSAIDEVELVHKMVEFAGLKNENIQFKAEKVVKKPKDDQSGNTQVSIVVQFKTEDIMSNVLSKIKAGKVYNKLGEIIQSGDKVYCNEYLTPYYKKLLFEAKRVKIDKKYEYLWVKKGKILLRKQNGSKVETLICNNDLSKM